MIINIDGERPDHISPEDWEKFKQAAEKIFREEFPKKKTDTDRPDWQLRMLQTFGGDSNV